MKKLEPTIEYTVEHDIPMKVQPDMEECIEKINEIVEWINSKKDQLL